MLAQRDRIEASEGLPPLRMRKGIHTGPVVVGTLGNDLRVEFKPVGDTLTLASRLEGLAGPGQPMRAVKPSSLPKDSSDLRVWDTRSGTELTKQSLLCHDKI